MEKIDGELSYQMGDNDWMLNGVLHFVMSCDELSSAHEMLLSNDLLRLFTNGADSPVYFAP